MEPTVAERAARRVRPFTPSQESPAVLSDRTVGREDLLRLLDRRFLTAAASRNRPHTLLIGPRGAGKTHIVEVAVHRALQSDIGPRLLFVRLDEDAIGITRYADILKAVKRELIGGPRTAGNVAASPEADIAAALGDRVLVLVIENLDRVFNALGKAGQQQFRAWVETSGQVMVLATAPLLFPGVGDRSLPWYGSFGITHLEDLDLDQGRELLIYLARESGDTALADFIESPAGAARLAAINALAGGSPRIWMILSECLTVELLDELVPAVEALLEGLVPYYQQLLWDLSGNEQRLVRELADGAHQAATVAELAAACDLDQRTAATTLGRLADLRWVRAEKVPSLDQRATWYRLREPMLRHHFQYRAAADQPLTLVVDLLRVWFDPAQRRKDLADAVAASAGERVLAATLREESQGFDAAYNDRNIEQLRVEARRWIAGADGDSRTADAGMIIDLAITAVREGPGAAIAASRQRKVAPYAATAINMITCPSEERDGGRSELDLVGDLLRLAAQSVSEAERTHAVLELVSACWDGDHDPKQARDRLVDLGHLLSANREDDPLVLDVRHEAAYWTGEAGDPVRAHHLLAALIPIAERTLGPEHLNTLRLRESFTHWAAEAGDPASARDQLATLIPIAERALGAEHPDTLGARGSFAHRTGQAGDPGAARDQFATLISAAERALGPEHFETLSARRSLAYWTGQAGDPLAAQDQLASLIPVMEHALGPAHRETLRSRRSLAHWTGKVGDRAAARDQLAALVPFTQQLLGPDDPDTLSTRHSHAYWTGQAGDRAAARDLLAALIPVIERVLGSNHPDTFSIRHGLAYWIGHAGDPSAARDQFVGLLPRAQHTLGPEHAETLSIRWSVAHWTGEAGEPAAACDLAVQLLSDLTGRPSRDLSLIASTRDLMARSIAQLLTAPIEQDADAAFDAEGAGLAATLQAAAAGSAEALVRLPTELVPIIDALRAGRTEPS